MISFNKQRYKDIPKIFYQRSPDDDDEDDDDDNDDDDNDFLPKNWELRFSHDSSYSVILGYLKWTDAVENKNS